jgi:hypothetical protein
MVPLDVGLRRTIEAFQQPTPRVPADVVPQASQPAEPKTVPAGRAIPAVQERTA